MKISLNKLIIGVSGVLIVLVSSYIIYVKFFYKKGGDHDIKPLTVEAQTVRRGGILQKLTVSGTLIADKSVDIKPQVQGTIKEIMFTAGAKVKAGDPLIQIDDDSFKAKVKDNEAKLEYAKNEYNRQSTLVSANAGVGKKKEEAYSAMLQAEANVDLAKLDLKHSLIVAPFDGTVGLKNISIGQFVDGRDPILSIVDEDPIRVDFKLPEKYIKNLSVGQDVDIIVDGFGDQVFKAKVHSIDAKVDPNSHSLDVHAIMDNKDGILKPGLFVRVKIEVGHKENALIIPMQAVKITGEESSVYKVVEIMHEGKKLTVAGKVPIVRGITEGSQTEVERGLAEGDAVVVIGWDKFHNAPEAPVRIVQDIESEDEGTTPAKPVAPTKAPSDDKNSKNKK